MERRIRKSFLLLGVGMGILALFVLLVVLAGDLGNQSRLQAQQLEIHILDVGQGDAMFIQLPAQRKRDRQQILVDTGKDMSVFTELGKIMPWWDRSIDVLVATHNDNDHIGVAFEVLERFEISYVIDPGFEMGTDSDSDSYLRALQAHTDVLRTELYETLTVDPLEIITLYPSVANRDTFDKKANNQSIFLTISYNEFSFLSTADADAWIEEFFVETHQPGDIDILKVGHHGSKNSTSYSFLKSITPEMGIISAGARNRYGHPHKDVIARLDDNNVETLCTCWNGTVSIFVDQEGKRTVSYE